MRCGVGHCGHCQLGPTLICRDGPVYPYGRDEPLPGGEGAVSAAARSRSSPSGSSRPATAASSRCSTARTSCSRSPARSRSPTSSRRRAPRSRARTTSRSSRARSRPRTTPSASTRCASSRSCWSRSAPARPPAGSRRCGTSPTSSEWIPLVYATPEFISTLDTSTPIADHVTVDLELRGCPISKAQLVETVSALLNGRRPHSRRRACASSARRAGRPASWSRDGTPCLGPVTQAGCGAICPAYERGCYGCFGPMETPNIDALASQWQRARRGRRAASSARSARSTRTRPRSRRRAWPMSEQTRDDPHRLPRARRGRGRDARAHPRRRGRGGAVQDLRAAALLRGAPARPATSPRRPTSPRASAASARSRTMTSSARPRWRRPAASSSPSRSAAPPPAPLLRRVDREPRAARLRCSTRPTSSATTSAIELASDHRDARRARAAPEEDRQRGDARGRRPRGAPDQRPGRRLLPRAVDSAELARARRRARVGARGRARD